MGVELLLLEDDVKTAAFLRRGLEEQGFTVEVAKDGAAGLEAFRSRKPQLMILDVMLPEVDGWDVLSEVRAGGDRCPVLMLTARDAIEDRVKGLELGADDYLVKPFAFPELVARIRTMLRRGGAPQPTPSAVITVGELVIDQIARTVTRGGRRIELTSREFQLLAFLARRAGEIVSRTEIARQVWDLQFDSGTNIVEVHIRRLRLKIEEGHARKLIRTERGLGYVLDP